MLPVVDVYKRQREQGLRTQKILTLDELGRRIALGNFQELNIIVKGDVCLLYTSRCV